MNTKHKSDERVRRLVQAVGKEIVPRKGIMAELGLRQNSRRNFYANYLTPAIAQGYVCMLRPGSPSSPEQAYRLSAAGLELLAELVDAENSPKEDCLQ